MAQARGRRPPGVPAFASVADLGAWLEGHGVPVELWGQGEAKTLEHLYAEVEAGECRLEVSGGRVERTVPGAHLHVRYRRPDGAVLRLKEARQVFRDGRVRRRDLDTSVGEKMTFGEDHRQAALRALSEELGVAGVAVEYLGLDEDKVVSSKSYPGLVSHYRTHLYSCWLTDEHYRAEGYVERQPDKTSYWVWVEEEPA